MAELTINTRSTALLVMDCQNGIVGSLTPAEKDKVLTNLQKVIPASRQAGIPVFYVVIHFREGYPEISDNNAQFRGAKEAGRLKGGSLESEVCPEIKPQPGDVVVLKKRISAFTGSDLTVVLRAKNINTLVLTGVSTLGVVESTARFAVDMDYRVIVIEDCCSDRDPEMHRIGATQLLPRIATVVASGDYLQALSRPS